MCRIITETELQQLTDSELKSLFNKVTQQLIQSDRGTAARCKALASLDNIQRAMAARMARPYLKLPGF